MQLKRYATPALAAALATSALAWHGMRDDAAGGGVPFVSAAHAQSVSPAVTPAAVGLPDFTELVSRASPAVVNISATRTMPTANHSPFGGGAPGGPDNPYFEFFKRFGPPQGDGGEGPIARSGGSGFIVSPDGHVLTNAHVVAGADEVVVQLADRREFRAKVIGADETTDVALIKIDAQNLPTLKVGDPERLKVGEWVIAIGSPFGLDHTVSAGVVSAKTRSLPNGSYVPFIQTDVAINPGNSGGPLLNLAGEVIGINAQIYSQTGGYMGLSFAIPIDLAMNVQQQLAQDGKVTRGRLGVGVQSLNQDLAQSFGLDTPQGALVSQVEEGMPAARAGLRAGDVILRFDGAVVEDSAMLSRLVAAKKPGDRVQVELLRAGKHERLEVALGSAPGNELAAAGGDERGDGGRLGVVVQELPPTARDGGRGVVVAAVSGAAARAGIREGDVILAINSEPVESASKLKALMSRAPAHVAVLLQREDAQIFVPVNLG